MSATEGETNLNATTGQDVWYLARDGKQHGPLSDSEMKKLVELGHLKANDLVWKPGFADWRAAQAVFPPDSPTQAPATRTEPTRASAAPAQSQPQSPGGFVPAQLQTTQLPTSQVQPGLAQAERTMPAAAAKPQQSTYTPASAAPLSNSDGEQLSSGAGRRFAIAGVVLALIGGGGYLGVTQKDKIGALLKSTVKTAEQAAKPDGAAPATAQATAAIAATPEAPPPAKPSSADIDAIDKQFQKTPLWVLLKTEFPEWYKERLDETATLSFEKKPEAEVIGKLVQGLVALRRQNADKALSASPAKLQEIATAFLGNLKALQARSVESCYGFISKGESEPTVVDLMQKGAESAPIQAQMQAIFSAAVEGRKTPAQRSAPVKSDYDVLASELGALGWSQADIQLFADPKALAQAPRDRVCKMVQDWFSAHLAVKDAATQERLLFETLRPVVAG